LFENAEEPYVYESFVLNAALTSNEVPFVLEDNEIAGLLYKYFYNYCKEYKEITQDFRRLHSACIELIEPNNISKPTRIQPRAEELFQKHFKRYLTSEDLASFIKHVNPGEEFFMLNEEWIRHFFKDDVQFGKYLKIAKNLERSHGAYKEFMEFYEKVKQNEYPAIEYKFRFLKPSRWQY